MIQKRIHQQNILIERLAALQNGIFQHLHTFLYPFIFFILRMIILFYITLRAHSSLFALFISFIPTNVRFSCRSMAQAGTAEVLDTQIDSAFLA